jgi:hypothetical protein
VTETVLALAALFGVPAALVTLIVLAALTVTRRRSDHTRQGPGPTPAGPGPVAGGGGPVARHAWTAAHLAHARIARLEQRVRQLEALTTSKGGDRR